MDIYQKLIGLLNVNNFYDGLLTFINHAIKNHFVSHTVKKLFTCTSTANELLDLLQAYTLESNPRLMHWIGRLMMVVVAVVKSVN